MLVVGLLALAAISLPLLLRDRLISFPIVIVGSGALLALVFEPGSFDLVDNGPLAEHVAEFAVIVALTGLGLSIDRPITLRGWSTAWRLLALTMPLTIAATMLLGWWWLGLTPAAALLLAAAMAPTDPVLAVDVQTGPPTTGDPDADELDEVRFGLTSESALNDGLAFPFVNLAIILALGSTRSSDWLVDWLLIDVTYKLLGGVVYGWLVGKALGWATIKMVGGDGLPGLLAQGERLAPSITALAFTLVSFGVAEILNAYGFIAVFMTAYTIRNTERQNHVHDRLHEGAEQLELLAMSIVLLLLGAAFADGIYAAVTWQTVAFAVVLVLLVRPGAGWTGLLGSRRAAAPERSLLAFFGIRGLGSIYYLAYGLNHADFADPQSLWALVSVTIFASLLVHGLSARPSVAWLERRRAAAAAVGETEPGQTAVDDGPAPV